MLVLIKRIGKTGSELILFNCKGVAATPDPVGVPEATGVQSPEESGNQASSSSSYPDPETPTEGASADPSTPTKPAAAASLGHLELARLDFDSLGPEAIPPWMKSQDAALEFIQQAATELAGQLIANMSEQPPVVLADLLPNAAAGSEETPTTPAGQEEQPPKTLDQETQMVSGASAESELAPLALTRHASEAQGTPAKQATRQPTQHELEDEFISLRHLLKVEAELEAVTSERDALKKELEKERTVRNVEGLTPEQELARVKERYKKSITEMTGERKTMAFAEKMLKEERDSLRRQLANAEVTARAKSGTEAIVCRLVSFPSAFLS